MLCRDVLCTDKTGTLTVDTVRLVAHLDALLRPSQDVFQLAFANSFFQARRRTLSLTLRVRASPHEPRTFLRAAKCTWGFCVNAPLLCHAGRFSAMLVTALSLPCCLL